MTLEAWLKNRLWWLLFPAVAANTLVVAFAVPYAAFVDSLAEGSLQLLVVIAATVALSLEFLVTGYALQSLQAFRGLVSGRTTLTAPTRLAALAELRRLAGPVSFLVFGAWLLGVLVVGLSMVALVDAPWSVVGRLLFIGLLFGPLAATLTSLLLTTRSHEAFDALADGLAPHEIIAAVPAVAWSIRGRTVAFTVLVTVMPVIMLADVARVALDHAADQLALVPLAARQLAADALFRQIALRLLALGALAVAFAVLMAAAAGRAIAHPMQRLAAEARRVAAGHLGAPRVIAADGEVWRVTGVFAQLQERLGGLVEKVLDAGRHLRTATDSLQRTSSRSEATAADQAAALNETSATTEELARSARQIAGNAAAVQELARRTLEAADQGQHDAHAFQAAVERMKADNRSIAGAVDRLRRRVQQIGRIVELINTVADRSDLLALSAELEGTRAGEVGRGFSLVGAEMRRLAENVLESTAEVEELIAEIRDATVRTAEATDRGSALTERATGLADQVTAALSQVGILAGETATEVRTISLGTQQQQSGTDQLAEAMADILTGTQAEYATTQRITQVNQQLLGLSASLQTVVHRFLGSGEGR